MSSAPAPSSKHLPSPDVGAKAADKLVVYRHSNLFYWWPIWALGFLFGLFTYLENWRLAVVPAGTEAALGRLVDVDGAGSFESRDVLIIEKTKRPLTTSDENGNDEPVQPQIFVSPHRGFGSAYVIVLLIVITFTNITIRGLGTVFVSVVLIMLTFILAAGGWWGIIFDKVGHLSIHINMGGYLLISTVLLVLWLVNFLFFDRYTYMVFTPGQVRVRMEIGGEDTVYDTTGMVVQKQRMDLFRHWILGFGSGDLIIKPVGLANPIEFPNVLGVGSKVIKIERMMKEKVIVRAPAEQKQPGA